MTLHPAEGKGDDVDPDIDALAGTPGEAVRVENLAVEVSPLEVLPLEALPAPQFCTACGAAWEPTWLNCGACAPAAGAAAVGRRTIATAPSLKGTVWLYFALLLATLCGIAVAAVAAKDGSPLNDAELEMGIALVHTLIVVGWVTASRAQVLPLLGQAGGVGWYGMAIGLAPLTFLAATAAIRAAMHLPGMTQIRYAQPFLDAGYGWGTVVLFTCVQPAVFEELAFRGVILGGLRRALTDREALVVSTMMFALLHLSVPSMPHLVLIGAALGWLRLRSNSLYPGMAMHFLHNALCLGAEALGH